MQCAKCNYDNLADALFCMKCGVRLENRCASCQTINPADANFCRKCGNCLQATRATRDLAVRSSAAFVDSFTARHASEDSDGERKTVTALFADIKGSME